MRRGRSCARRGSDGHRGGEAVLGDAPVAYASSSPENAVADGDAVVLVTRWKQFEALPGLLAGRTSPPLVLDGRRLLAPQSVPRYAGIGL